MYLPGEFIAEVHESCIVRQGRVRGVACAVYATHAKTVARTQNSPNIVGTADIMGNYDDFHAFIVAVDSLYALQ